MKKKTILNCGPVDTQVTVPGSKSLTNRALLIAALTQGTSILTGVLDSEDTRIMFKALQQLGLTVSHDHESRVMVIEGQGGDFPVRTGDIYVGNSGTTARFLTAALARSDGEYRLFGKPRMHQRPIGDLIQTLQHLGGDVQSETGNNCPPLLIKGRKNLGGTASVAANISSQFLSALLMMGVSSPLKLKIEGELVSRPYIEMTLAVLRAFGAKIETDATLQLFTGFEKTHYSPQTYPIEPDASAASYFFALPAIVGGKVTVKGLSRSSLQGDVAFVDCLAAMGCSVRYEEGGITVERQLDEQGTPIPLEGIDVDMNDISDTVQTLAVVALFASSPTRIRNVAHIRHKETDRIAAVVTELRKLGVRVDEFEDGLLVWSGAPSRLHGASIATYDDHRMAMSFALAGLAIEHVEIENPECTAKTYPQFFADLARAVAN